MAFYSLDVVSDALEVVCGGQPYLLRLGASAALVNAPDDGTSGTMSW